MKNNGREEIRQSQKYMALQEVVYITLSNVILEFENIKLYSTFDLPRSFFQ